MYLIRYLTAKGTGRTRLIKRIVSYGLLGVLLLIGLGVWLNDQYPLPKPHLEQAQVVVANDGTPLWRFADKQGVWRYYVTLDQVSPLYLETLLIYEDRWFYQHPGINPLALLRAAWLNLGSKRIISGGSTLSMQVARLLDPHSRTWRGKLKQLARTVQLELTYSKDEILTLYINLAPFGGTQQGVAAASWSYLGKSPLHLTVSDAALLAVLPQAPSRLRPDRYPERAEAARNKVLQRLAQQFPERTQEVQEARQEKLFLAPKKEPQLAPLLARYLTQQSNSPTVSSLINVGLQQRLENMLLSWKERLPRRSSAAILVVNHRTMAVEGYAGSIDINDQARFAHVDMIQATRSPGSTLKPFLYGLALDEGLIHSESLLQDTPRFGKAYQPANFSREFAGAVSVSEALQQSLNVPVVQLLEHYGANTFNSRMQQAGIKLSYPDAAEPNLSLILGGVGLQLASLVEGYSAFARQGKVARLRYQPEDPLIERRLMSAGAAWITRQLLMRNRMPRTESEEIVRSIAWKTGTSYGFRDAWSIAITDNHLIGVWIGRPDGTPVAGQIGVNSAMPLIYQIERILAAQNIVKAVVEPRPSSVTLETICWPTGRIETADSNICRQKKAAWILNQTIPPTLDSPPVEPLWLNQNGLEVASSCEQAQKYQFAWWPTAVEPWLPESEHKLQRLPQIDANCPPAKRQQLTSLNIIGINEGDTLHAVSNQQQLLIPLSVQGTDSAIYWYLNGDFVGKGLTNQPFILNVNKTGPQQINVMSEDGKAFQLKFTASFLE